MPGFKKYIDFPIITLMLSLLFIIIQLVTALNYPIFRDELYYIDCANHPAFGYVDHPPLSIWILMVWKFIFGDSQISIRVIPALCGALLIMLTAAIAKELGGNRLSQIFASLIVFSGLYFLATGGFYSMNVFDSVFWALLFLVLIKIITNHPLYASGDSKSRMPVLSTAGQADLQNSNEKEAEGNISPSASPGALWILFGITAGLGLMNKISVGYLGIGIIAAIILTQNRVWFKQKYLWIGGIIAIAVFLPYVIWNLTHDFATLEFIRNAQKYKIAALSPVDFLKEQILLNNPLSAPVWIAGLIALLFTKRLNPFRIIGLTYIVILVMLIIMRSKAYYLSAAYPVLIAAGAVIFNPGRKRRIVNIFIYSYMFLLIASAAILSPMVIPVLSPDDTAAHIKSLGLMPSTGENSELGGLPQILADRFGWEELTDKVAKIYNTLPDEEKKTTVIYAKNYGEAGAINYYGRKYGLPQCYSGHNNHYFWGPPADSVTSLIIIGGKREDHLETLSEVTEMDRTNNPYAMPYENGMPIYLGRGLKRPLKDVWKSVKFYI